MITKRTVGATVGKLTVKEAVEKYIEAFPGAGDGSADPEIFLTMARPFREGRRPTQESLGIVYTAWEIVTSCEDPAGLFETLAAITRLQFNPEDYGI